MIENLAVENYRSFQNYSMNNLKRVNLLTGLNNSGKTSLLEAVEIHSNHAQPHSLANIARRRSEYVSVIFEYDGVDDGDETDLPSFSNFIHGHTCDHGKGFLLQVNNSELLAVCVTKSTSGKYLEVSIDGKPVEGAESTLTEHGGMLDTDSSYPSEARVVGAKSSTLFVGSSSLGIHGLRFLWNRMIESGTDALLHDSLKMIDQRIRDVQFRVSSSNRRSSGTYSGILVGYEGERRRIPLGSQGEGVRRMLAFAVALSSVSGGILLVDEIDTGLHYSVLADMWKLVIGTAIKNDIQVFATTHSLDCLRGLNEACQSNSEYAAAVSTQTIDRSLPVSISGDATDLRSAIDLGIEVR